MRTRSSRILRALRDTLAGCVKPSSSLVLDADQTLVLGYHKLTAAEHDRIVARIRADFPGLPVLLVVADDVSTKRR